MGGNQTLCASYAKDASVEIEFRNLLEYRDLAIAQASNRRFMCTLLG